MQPTPATDVRAWLDAQAADSVRTTAINVMELRVGVELLPAGKRKDRLARSLDALVNRLLADRIVAFDLAAAEASARIFAQRRAQGRTVEWRDTQIAGVVLSRTASFATRNTRDFDDLGIKLINPWTCV